MPIIYSELLNQDMNWTDYEYSVGKKYLKWEEINLTWDQIDLTWDQIFIIIEIVKKRGGGSSGYPYKGEYEKNNPWRKLNQDFGEENTEKIIKLYCDVRGIKYEKVKNKKSDIKVTVNEFDRFINEVINVKINI